MKDEWHVIIGKEQSIHPLGRDDELNIQRGTKLYELGITNLETIPLLGSNGYWAIAFLVHLSVNQRNKLN